MYRFLVILAAAGSAVLMGFCIYFQIMALSKWRADDLFTATSVTNFVTEKGTCVEVITADQISAGVNDNDCSGSGVDPDITGSLRNLRNTLAVSVHGLYHAYTAAGANGADVNWQLMEVTKSVLSSTLNPDAIGAGVNFTAAKGALEQVADSSVPRSCDTIYGHVPGDVTGDPTANAFYKSLIAGKKDKDDSDDTRGDWPLGDITVNCEDTGQTPGLNEVDLDALTPAQKLNLYAHCLVQFQFAASGTDPWAGTTCYLQTRGLSPWRDMGGWSHPFTVAGSIALKHTNSADSRALLVHIAPERNWTLSLTRSASKAGGGADVRMADVSVTSPLPSFKYIGLPLKTISSSFKIISFTEISYSSIKRINSSDDKFLLLRSISTLLAFPKIIFSFALPEISVLFSSSTLFLS